MNTASTPLPAVYPRFRYDGSGDLAPIGLIYIASSVVMEEEMWSMDPESVGSVPGIMEDRPRPASP